MKNLNKKVGVLALSGLALIGGNLANVSVAHANSSNLNLSQEELYKNKRKQNEFELMKETIIGIFNIDIIDSNDKNNNNIEYFKAKYHNSEVKKYENPLNLKIALEKSDLNKGMHIIKFCELIVVVIVK